MSIQDARHGRSTVAAADERTFAIVAHLSAIAAMILSAGSLSFLGPLIVWFVYKDRSPFVRQAAAGSFNFNLWAWVMSVIAWVLVFTVILIPVSIVLWAVAGIMTLWCHIRAAMKAAKHEPYRYPASIPVLS